MTLEPALTASLPIQIHLATVVPAFFLGAYLILVSRKGSTAHRALGWIYLALMTVTTITALFIHELNPNGPLGFSPIHLLIPLTLYGIVGAIYYARTHDMRRHRQTMILVYVGGLLIAGAFTFMPGRVMHDIFFG
ncbi:MAG: DUF2306 domain-containing protein [Hyphomonadaceae bacterium]|nr:DUF2306 domain-containing protein [Hyphomonadaceae bacterium]